MKTMLLICISAASLLVAGQAADNTLTGPAAAPLDHAFSMKEEGVVAYDEGQEHLLPAPATLLDGTVVERNGQISRPDGVKFNLELGQIITRAGEVQEADAYSASSEASAPAVKQQ